MTKTPNYNLNQWDPEDKVIRTDFNEDNARLDAALASKADASTVSALQTAVAGKADTSAVSALQTTVAGKGNCRILCGTYRGSGQYGADYPNTLDFAKTMGKAPALIFVTGGGSDFFWSTRGSALFHATPTLAASYYIYITWTETGLSWYNKNSTLMQLSMSTITYRYCALFD